MEKDMLTYKNTVHLGIIPKVGDITDMGCVVMIEQDGLIVADHQRRQLVKPNTVNLVIRKSTVH